MELRAVGKEASHGSSHLKKENNEKKHYIYWDCGDRYRLLANGCSHHAWSQTDWLTTSKHCLISSVRLLWTSRRLWRVYDKAHRHQQTMNKISSVINNFLYIHHDQFHSCSSDNLTTVHVYCIFTFTHHSNQFLSWLYLTHINVNKVWGREGNEIKKKTTIKLLLVLWSSLL